MAPLWPYSQSLQNITQVNETKVSHCMRVGAVRSPGSAWQGAAPTASRDRGFRLMSSHWDQRVCFAKCSSCFKKKKVMPLRQGAVAHWSTGGSSQTQSSSGPPYTAGAGGGLHPAGAFSEGIENSLACRTRLFMPNGLLPLQTYSCHGGPVGNAHLQ